MSHKAVYEPGGERGYKSLCPGPPWGMFEVLEFWVLIGSIEFQIINTG